MLSMAVGVDNRSVEGHRADGAAHCGTGVAVTPDVPGTALYPGTARKARLEERVM